MIRRSWMAVMTSGSAEATLEVWAASLRDVKGRIRPLFQQQRMAASAGLFLDALLGPERRKTGWMRAEAAGDPGPWRQQALLGRAWWDADALRDEVRDYAVETLADPDAVLVVDETGFLKQGVVRGGPAGHGVSRQDHHLPDRGVRHLRVEPGARLHRPPARPPSGLEQGPGSPARGARAR